MKTNIVVHISLLITLITNHIHIAHKILGFKLQYFKNKVNDEVYFLQADKHRLLLQIDTIILSVYKQA